MIRNRYYYLAPSVQDTKGKAGRTLSNGTTIKTLQAESQKDQDPLQNVIPSHNKNWPNVIQTKNFTRTYMQRYTITEINLSRSAALEKYYLAGGGGGWGRGSLNRFYMATILAPSSAVVQFSPSEGFLTHQCKISENIKIKRLQR